MTPKRSFVTAQRSAEVRAAATEDGALRFTTNPFAPDDLRDAIARFA
ncbi:MAG TPA: hypothetical protein VED63_01045 [Acidimicrobiales bacterium]|nr:hypothetical protein [Acidimicrobiales bacterium]